MKHCNSWIFGIILTVTTFGLLSACSTGIEGTRTIKMSRHEQRDTRPGAEDLLAAMIVSENIENWRPGKCFIVADNKASLLLENKSYSSGTQPDSLKGHQLSYQGLEFRPTPGGASVSMIEFEEGSARYLYNTEKSEDKVRELTGLDLPMLIDLDMVQLADSLLRERQVWTLISLWYDREGNVMHGRKFVPATITSVTPGNMVFPLLVNFRTDDGSEASLLMNIKVSHGLGAESRTFPSLFSLSDPKLKYPNITPEVWELICNDKVALGMTKEECRLALGNPSEVDAGHNWSSVFDVWGYKDGTFLQFQDGLLVNFRH